MLGKKFKTYTAKGSYKKEKIKHWTDITTPDHKARTKMTMYMCELFIYPIFWYCQSHAMASRGKSTGQPKIQARDTLYHVRMPQTIKTSLIFKPQLITAPCRVNYTPLGF